ncbi:Uma2 family endonuclease [Pseudanabaena sp. UWO310]|uniref:Uma2 family endonuclease n=1 Tax=Pseudanabaena sp. UWO310 TaxID=2480795 RepID=UPI00115B60CF|nr:Uma2 family endonuclease [Pseudanabaena sp. UWO310]TYQ27091.1 Uma2 family endonuclease [Pseudanabaena sp. UWO310]
MQTLTIPTPVTDKKIWTDAELMALTDGNCYELVHGELVNRGNSGALHGYTCSLLVMALMNYILPRQLGIILDSTAFTMKNGNKRSPDISFVSKEKLQGLTELPDGFLDGSPDLAIEVLSPNNTIFEIDQKIVEYFENGSRLVWVINLKLHYVLVYRSAQEPDRLLKQSDDLDGEDVIEGFTMPLSELFQKLSF